ncbi:MAG: four helix bundle protein [bacterium]
MDKNTKIQGFQDLIRFLSIANGSVNEVRAQLLLAERLGYIDHSTTNRLLDLSFEITKMIKVLSNRLR